MTGSLLYLTMLGVIVICGLAGDPTAATVFKEIFNWTHVLLACGIVGICIRLNEIRDRLEKRK